MVSVHLAKASIKELKEQIKEAEKRKKHLKDYLEKLHKAYHKKQITYSQYVETFYKEHGEKSIHVADHRTTGAVFMRHAERRIFVAPYSAHADHAA